MNRAASLSSQPTGTTTTTNNTQFKHTYLWNNIITHLKKTLLASGSSYSTGSSSSSDNSDVSTTPTYTHRLRKQHSRFVTGGMLLIKQNLLSNGTGLTLNSDSLDNICFTGAQCVDIVYSYLTSKDQIANFERQVTRDKVTKLCQTIMDTGVFEPVSRTSTKFDDSLLKFYRFKVAELAKTKNDRASKKSESKDDLVALSHNKEKRSHHFFTKNPNGQMNNAEDTENNNSNKNIVGMAFNKCKMINQKATLSNTKLKRKVTSMKRSSTIQTLMPVEKLAEQKSTDQDQKTTTTKARADILQRIDSNTIIDQLNTQITKSKLDSTSSRDGSSTANINKPVTAAQDLLLIRQITRELVIEKLLSLIDLPVIEQLLVIDECNDIDYRELMEKIDSKLNFTNIVSSSSCKSSSALISNNSNTNNKLGGADENQNTLGIPGGNTKALQRKHSADSGLAEYNVLPVVCGGGYAHRRLAILNQTYDLNKCDSESAWRKSAHDCLEFIEWSMPSCTSLNSIDNLSHAPTNNVLAAKLANAFNNNSETTNTGHHKLLKQSHQSQKLAQLAKLSDLELYHIIKDYYSQKRHCFLDDSFQPLFTHILSFLRNSQYMKALETLNLGTLLLLKQTQAELKRLLKFLYLTANFTNAPRLTENKQNNSVLLNHFAGCLFNTKLLAFEECRLILNFMLNNFDHLFKLSKSLEESICKRRLMRHKYGHEEALIEKSFCKRMTNKEYIDGSKDQTTKALVDLINHIVDDPQISLKQKKLKLKALQRIHPEIYEKYFSDLF